MNLAWNLGWAKNEVFAQRFLWYTLYKSSFTEIHDVEVYTLMPNYPHLEA